MPTPADRSAEKALDKYRRLGGEDLVAQLRALGYDAVFVRTRTEALEELLNRVPAGATVGVGGSLTLGQIGARPSASGVTRFSRRPPTRPGRRSTLCAGGA
jgi:hypothetical protein